MDGDTAQRPETEPHRCAWPIFTKVHRPLQAGRDGLPTDGARQLGTHGHNTRAKSPLALNLTPYTKMERMGNVALMQDTEPHDFEKKREENLVTLGS